MDWKNIFTSKIFWAAAGLIALAVVLGIFSAQDSCRWRKGVDADKAAVQEQANALRDINANIADLQRKQKEAEANLKAAANAYTDSINATDKTREEVNRAVANYANAVDASKGGNRDVSSEELEKILHDLP